MFSSFRSIFGWTQADEDFSSAIYAPVPEDVHTPADAAWLEQRLAAIPITAPEQDAKRAIRCVSDPNQHPSPKANGPQRQQIDNDSNAGSSDSPVDLQAPVLAPKPAPTAAANHLHTGAQTEAPARPPQPLPTIAQHPPAAVATPHAPQPQPAVLQNVAAAAPPAPEAQLPAATALTITAGVPPPVQPQPQPGTAQNIAVATPSAPQVQPTPSSVPSSGLVLPQLAPSAQTRYKRPRRPAYARPLVPGDFYDPVAYARNPQGHDRAFNVLAQANLTGCPRFRNGTSSGPFAKNGELKGDFLSAVMINQSHGPCVNSYIRRYHGPAAQIFVGGGKMHRHMWDWYIALIQGPNGQFEEARYRRFVMEQVENQLLTDLPNLAQTIAQLKQIVVPPVGGALNPPVNLGQNGINQTIGSGFNALNNPGVHTMNQMAPAQGGGPTGGMWNGSIVGPMGGMGIRPVAGPNVGSTGLAGGYYGANTTHAGFHTPSLLPPSQGRNTQSSRKRNRQEKDTVGDSDSDVQDPSPSAQASKKARLFLAQPSSGVQHPLPPPFPASRNEPFRPGNKRQRDDVIVIDDDSDLGLAPPRPSKTRRLDGQTVKIETPRMQDWDGTLSPGMTLEDNYNRLMNSQQEGEQTEQIRPLQTQARRRPTARGARNAPQVSNSSLHDRGVDVGSPTMRDGGFQQPQFLDFDGYPDRGEESWEGRRYPSPTQFEYGQSRQPSQQSGYGFEAQGGYTNRSNWGSELPEHNGLPAAAQDYTYPETHQSRGNMPQSGFMNGFGDHWGSMQDTGSSMRRNRRKSSRVDDYDDDSSAYEMNRGRKHHRT
jgi:hypothetical protein